MNVLMMRIGTSFLTISMALIKASSDSMESPYPLFISMVVVPYSIAFQASSIPFSANSSMDALRTAETVLSIPPPSDAIC